MIATLYLGSSLTHSLTDGATLGQSRAGQGRPHGNIIGPHGTRLVDEKRIIFQN